MIVLDKLEMFLPLISLAITCINLLYLHLIYTKTKKINKSFEETTKYEYLSKEETKYKRNIEW